MPSMGYILHVYKRAQQAHGGEQIYLAVIAQCFSQHPLNIPHNCNLLLSGQRVVDMAWSWTCLEMGRALFFISSRATLKDTATAKNGGISP